ncbi:methyl-accepting chemotaxis protein [Enterovibrio nigricans]|uniref:Methyl-accepting chemotaxis protein n=1 Tax=Enterovibrio nigricans DSM 22720 TaxID=1121868 RepID=A0A1T4U3V3_9GAMM|nr:methyl-accepting chemotaxis protein [Enterovibrio nigricans]PKF51846.1 methyl-accepting chemotaxis protein [Enterovibrio nigricans]SKA47353.1 methyl-accepting chemotaxis protein [Enterovibrio nigricans DSM 22720]
MTLTLKQKLIGTCLIAVIAMATTLSLLAANQLSTQTENSLEYRVRSSSDVAKVGFIDWLDAHATAMKGFIETQPHDDEINALKMIQISGNFAMTFYGEVDGSLDLSNGATIDIDPRQRPWYIEAVTENRTIFTAPYRDALTGETMVTVAEPVLQGGQLQGVLGGDISLRKIMSDISQFDFGDNAFGMLFTDKGTLIAHKDASLNGAPLTQYNPALNMRVVQDAARQGTLIHQNINGSPKAYYFVSLPTAQWYIGIELDLNTELEAHNSAVTTLILTSLGVTLVVLALSIWLVNILFRDLNRVSKAMAEIASGEADLTQRLTPHSEDEVGQLAHNFNTFVGNMHTMVVHLKNVGEALSEQAAGAAEHANIRSSRIRGQQDEINMVATAINQMAAATQEIASSAENTAQLSKDAVGRSHTGASQVNQSQLSIGNLSTEVESATSVITELHAHTQSINSILSTIQDIAEQTNLLALNAAIEAARAGAQGRGFAVVADEVRVLSQRTHDSTREIQATIETLQSTTQSAVKIMQDSRYLATTSVEDASSATDSLTQITTSVSTISDMATQIASAAEEQSLVTAEITRNTEAVRHASDELAEEANQASMQASDLSSLSQQLNNEISRFKL